MSTFVIKDQKVYIGGYNVTGDIASVSFGLSAEEKAYAALGAGSRSRLAGVRDGNLDLEGHYQSGASPALIDDILFPAVGGSVLPVTIGVVAGTDGEIAYIFESLPTEYEVFGEHGEIAPFRLSAPPSGPVVRGTIMHTATRTASGDGTARQLGAVSATQKLYAALHVIAASGTDPTLDVKIQSDALEGFGSATDVITFAQKTAIGSQWAIPVAGAITDDWWRVDYTIGGTDPSFTFVVTVGIL